MTGNYTYTRSLDTLTGNPAYEFPPHMTHLRVSYAAAPGLWLSGLVDMYGRRPRTDWSPDAGLEDGPPFALMHAAMSTDVLADGRVRLDASVRTVLNSTYETLISVEDANTITDSAGVETAAYPYDLQGPGRDIVVGIEVVY